jgi:hypothetical protein
MGKTIAGLAAPASAFAQLPDIEGWDPSARRRAIRSYL